ncbi:PfaD family polyunsaturated fatty acid/polyketide biosynthesis protein [Collimonas sp.]|jgi:trans-AT polyketide synthase/acyltransferase/oxidoreductase domain-containing protein|uniref:PfaD family polyunsaturated fatty acid/polyketide biosynthesis protein n=1 Tax=Collimonas sp. TaxID=1963772 RepID=UPI002D0DAB41|nr:PfaD family polyunsaturated fatty acid/polyketide biosynthesis protein [Collimonas sp.]HWX00156.1 PfaD family polyunsaturated fatty acid/polyketide biosynthesis protein [Collimonas sp.]
MSSAAHNVAQNVVRNAEQLGSAAFRQRHGLRLAYMAGAMANGIAGEALVESLTRAGCLASFGAAGLSLQRTEAAIAHLRAALPGKPLCFNLIHTPDDPELELALVELYLKNGIETVEASAFMSLSPAIVLYRARGAHIDAAGRAIARNRVIAKVSRREVAEPFFRPAPETILSALLASGALTAGEAAAARLLPVADDVTVEADSGGHTDRQSLVCALPALALLRERIARSFSAAARVGLGAAGGMSTPAAIAAAFAMGADYIVTGSVNQACVEAATSPAVKRLLAEADLADVAMAPAADMFELGVQVQVLKRGSLFAVRATALWDLYRTFPSLEALPPAERERLERQFFRLPFTEIIAATDAFWRERNPALANLATRDPKVQMGLVFRWYLGQSSRWAILGQEERLFDYQVWCGPAMGAFNAWAADTRFAKPEARRAAEIADALMKAATERSFNGAAPSLALHDASPVALPIAATDIKATAGSPQSEEDIQEWLMEQIADQLAVSTDEIDPRRTFESYALDSARALLILTRLETRLSLKLSPTLIWNYPTIEALAARLYKMSQDRNAPAEAAAEAAQPA